MSNIIKINFVYILKLIIKFTAYVNGLFGFIGISVQLYDAFHATNSLKYSVIILFVIDFVSFLFAVM